jgi:DNA repair exonuclease SbcCD ATPase subunit
MAASTNEGIVVEVPVEETPPTSESNSRLFTEDDVANIRRQEKDKLYKKIEEESSRVKSLEEQLSVISKEREEARREAEERAKAEQELIRQREAEELSAKELLSVREQEFNQKLQSVEQEFSQRLAEIEQQRQAQAALLEREREIQAIESYRQRRIDEESEAIIPELRDLISGNNQDEIEASIAVLRDRSNAIINSIQQATQQSRLRGAPVTAPPTGPLENQTEYQTLSADDIRNMPMDQYMKMRERLMSAARTPRGRF